MQRQWTPSMLREEDGGGIGQTPNFFRQESNPQPDLLAVITKQSHTMFGDGRVQYEMEEVLGEGSYGAVYKCHRTKDKAVFAVKIIDTMRIGFVGGKTGVKAAEIMAVRECDALRQLSSHPHIVSFESAFIQKKTRQIFIVTEYINGSHLFSHIVQRTTPLKEAEASHIVSQLSDALCFCHALGVVHRDIKLENILVANVDMQLVEQTDPATGAVDWQMLELFDVKICDFGFAKSLQTYTTRTPIGTGSYAAPEIKLNRSDTGSGDRTPEVNKYDAFKADSFSLGIILFVMLCLAFPSKDEARHPHREHKNWPLLSAEAQAILDGLLEEEPSKRLTVVEAFNHPWVTLLEVDEPTKKKTQAKSAVIAQADLEGPKPHPRLPSTQARQDILPGIVALHRALVHMQQERGMACWSLAGSPGMGGISPADQLQWHMQLTEKRIREAKGSMETSLGSFPQVDDLLFQLAKARKLAIGVQATLQEQDMASLVSCFDSVFTLYNQACSRLIDIVANAIVSATDSSSAGRRAARKYRLFCAAAEQLGRERAFICAHGPGGKLCLSKAMSTSKAMEHLPTLAEVSTQEEMPHLEADSDKSEGSDADPEPSGAAESADTDCPEPPKDNPLFSDRMYRLAEIIGARKVLFGTIVDEDANDTVAAADGLLGTLIWEDEASLLSVADISLLESLERRVLRPTDGPAPMEEWFHTITRFLNEIHSRISINLLKDIKASRTGDCKELDRLESRASLRSEASALGAPREAGCCFKGLKLCLLSIADKL